MSRPTAEELGLPGRTGSHVAELGAGQGPPTHD